jgi:hypothetical protein
LSVIEAFGKVIKLTPEYLRLSLSDATIQELRSFVSSHPLLREAMESLLRWVDYPTIWIHDIIDVSIQAIPTTPDGEHLYKLVIRARYHGGERAYEIHLLPEDAERVLSEIKKLLQKRF